MRLFFRNIVLFIAICLVALLLMCIIPSVIIKRNASFKIKENTTSIVVGHSHSESSLNDSILANCENFSRSGEVYLYALCKVENIIRQNPNIKTVFVELTNNQFHDGMKTWLYSESYLQFHYATFFPFISIQNHLSLFYHSAKTYIKSLPIVIKNMVLIILKRNFEFAYQYGGFNASKNILSTNYDQGEPKGEFYMGNYSFLRQITDFCKKNSVRVVFFRSPQMPEYNGRYNEALYKSTIENDYPDVPYYDFDTLFNNNVSFFSDFEHLNVEGAKAFSIMFNDSVLFRYN